MEPNPKVKIISDSTCDLSQELTAKYDIDILPLHILLGENEFRDGKDITPERIFAWADANKATPKTSAPSLEDAKALLQPYVEAGREVICFSISGSMSTSGNVMRLAAEELDAAAQVTIIDSENLSTGIGLLVVEAAIMAEQGHSAAEITAAVRELIPKVRQALSLIRWYTCGAAGDVMPLPLWLAVRCGCTLRSWWKTAPCTQQKSTAGKSTMQSCPM